MRQNRENKDDNHLKITTAKPPPNNNITTSQKKAIKGEKNQPDKNLEKRLKEHVASKYSGQDEIEEEKQIISSHIDANSSRDNDIPTISVDELVPQMVIHTTTPNATNPNIASEDDIATIKSISKFADILNMGSVFSFILLNEASKRVPKEVSSGLIFLALLAAPPLACVAAKYKVRAGQLNNLVVKKALAEIQKTVLEAEGILDGLLLVHAKNQIRNNRTTDGRLRTRTLGPLDCCLSRLADRFSRFKSNLFEGLQASQHYGFRGLAIHLDEWLQVFVSLGTTVTATVYMGYLSDDDFRQSLQNISVMLFVLHQVTYTKTLPSVSAMRKQVTTVLKSVSGICDELYHKLQSDEYHSPAKIPQSTWRSLLKSGFIAFITSQVGTIGNRTAEYSDFFTSNFTYSLIAACSGFEVLFIERYKSIRVDAINNSSAEARKNIGKLFSLANRPGNHQQLQTKLKRKSHDNEKNKNCCTAFSDYTKGFAWFNFAIQFLFMTSFMLSAFGYDKKLEKELGYYPSLETQLIVSYFIEEIMLYCIEKGINIREEFSSIYNLNDLNNMYEGVIKQLKQLQNNGEGIFKQKNTQAKRDSHLSQLKIPVDRHHRHGKNISPADHDMNINGHQKPSSNKYTFSYNYTSDNPIPDILLHFPNDTAKNDFEKNIADGSSDKMDNIAPAPGNNPPLSIITEDSDTMDDITIASGNNTPLSIITEDDDDDLIILPTYANYRFFHESEADYMNDAYGGQGENDNQDMYHYN